MSEKETYGEVRSKDGSSEAIVALFKIYRDDREVAICETDKGSLVISTKIWLRENDRELVQTVNTYTKQTFVMMAEAMLLGAEYLGVNIQEQFRLLHASDGDQIKYECAGRGKPTFKSLPE